MSDTSVQGPFTIVAPFTVSGVVTRIEADGMVIVMKAEFGDLLSDICTLCANELVSRNIATGGVGVWATAANTSYICVTTEHSASELQIGSHANFNVDLELTCYIDRGGVALDDIKIRKFNHWV